VVSFFTAAILIGLILIVVVSGYSLFQCYKKHKLHYCLFVVLPEKLDSLFRKVDFWFSKSYGHKLLKFIFIEGHPKAAVILIFLALFFLIGGLYPGWTKVPAALSATLLITIVISQLAKRLQDIVPAESNNSTLKYFRIHALHFVSSTIILSLSGIIWFFLATDNRADFFYQHIHIPVISALITLSYITLLLRVLLLSQRSGTRAEEQFKKFSTKLNATELVWKPGKPVVSWATILYGFVSGPGYHALKLLLLPSLFIVFLPTEWMRVEIWGPLFGFSWLLLTFCTIHRRLHFVLTVTKRWFLTGGQLIVSLLIIALATGRIFEISYVSTLLDGVPILHMLFFVLSSYSALWLYEYWCNSLLCNHLLDYLRVGEVADRDQLSRIPYEYKREDGSTKKYFIELYSGARFAIVYQTQDGRTELENIYEKREIFREIAKVDKGLVALYSDLSKRIMLYFTLQNVFMIALTILTISWIIANNADAMVKATRITSETLTESNLAATQSVDLKELVLNRQAGNDKHVIFLAASGGGTRAAIYTTALLSALQEINKLDNVVLASGVSGGGMSLAYFAANRDKLIQDMPVNCADEKYNTNNNAWCKYFNVVADNHIMRVASRIGEARIFTDTSLGQFLADSFEQTFYVLLDNGKYKKVYLDQQTDMGLILNTSLIAHPYKESNMLTSALGEYEKKKHHENLYKNDLYKIDAGGRLIFTNIQNLQRFPWPNSDDLMKDAMDMRFKYVIAGGTNIPLHTIAALTANFPPVFPNAIVDLGGDKFNVSDGGAVENRGLLSLMFALRSLIEQISESKADLEKLPIMHIVMAEGSGVSIDYKNYESGLAAIANARVMIGNELVLALKSILMKKCGEPCVNKVQFHYLNMPLLMRSRGGLGTHWKMPSRVLFKVPSINKDQPDTKKELSGSQTICLMQALFTNDIQNRSAPIIKSSQDSDTKYNQCDLSELPEEVRTAFLSDNEALQKAWGRLRTSLTK